MVFPFLEQGGQPAIVDFLLQRGADVNAQNWRGQTALHFAYAFLYLPLADRLLASGARRDIQNFYGGPARARPCSPRATPGRLVAGTPNAAAAMAACKPSGSRMFAAGRDAWGARRPLFPARRVARRPGFIVNARAPPPSVARRTGGPPAARPKGRPGAPPSRLCLMRRSPSGAPSRASIADRAPRCGQSCSVIPRRVAG